MEVVEKAEQVVDERVSEGRQSSESEQAESSPAESSEVTSAKSEQGSGSEAGSEAEPAAVQLALVKGEPLTELPKDLYIPPEALEVFLETFQGPLDLLLYLIKRQNLDILDIPIAEITHQYMEYVELMKGIDLELAAEYLVMAAMLAEIKSRMLLPRLESSDDEEEDPRAELIRRLQQYEQFKQAAEEIDELPQLERDVFDVSVEKPEANVVAFAPNVELRDVLAAFHDVMRRADMFTHHQIQKETLSVRERMTNVLERVNADSFTDFSALFTPEEGRLGVIVSFLAILELIKESLLELVQSEPFAPIYVKARGSMVEQ